MALGEGSLGAKFLAWARFSLDDEISGKDFWVKKSDEILFASNLLSDGLKKSESSLSWD